MRLAGKFAGKFAGRFAGENEKIARLGALLNQNTDFIIPLISTGTGTGVSTLEMTVTDDTVLTIDGTGKFYDDSGGTINEGTTRTMVSGTIQTVYLKVPSGSCNITCTKGLNLITQINEWTSSTNAASIFELQLGAMPTGLTYIYIYGSNTISGSLADTPTGLDVIRIYGSNTISGNIGDAPTGLTYINIQGLNTISGSLSDAPDGLTYISIQGSNTISGNIGDAPTGLTYINIQGLNTISGSLADAPDGLTVIISQGSNTISGSLADAPDGLTCIFITGSNTISGYTAGRTWATGINRISITPVSSGGLDSTEVDNLLIDAAAATWGGSSRTLSLLGTNAARTSASDAAVATLIGQSVTVTTN